MVSAETLCHTLASVAQANGLPTGFFARLIWQESKFDQRIVSRAGAQGVAQFMPRSPPNAAFAIRSTRWRRCRIPGAS